MRSKVWRVTRATEENENPFSRLTLPHVPVTAIPNVVLAYRVHLNSSVLKEVFSWKLAFSRPIYHLKIRFLLENNPIMNTIVSTLLFKYQNVFFLNLETNFGHFWQFDLLERVVKTIDSILFQLFVNFVGD